MFRIHEEQMARLGERTRRRFVSKMADYFERAFPEWVEDMSRAELEGWVGDGVARAERYGVTTEPEVAQLLLLFLLLGADAAEKLDWFRAPLEDRDLQALGKVRRLVATARERRVEGLDAVVVLEETSP